MYFKKIEMHGFKSFAEPVTIDFSSGITCIVGPNGSGKSNISDAIRWVLGEQSPKMLRGGKMEEVIFSGTSSRKSRGMAEVTLVIDNAEGTLPIDYKEVALTRRMFRSGESEYHINGNQCRLRDIRELIMDTGIGVDGYSIIGQGKISEILSNKTESRREIFEEAAAAGMQLRILDIGGGFPIPEPKVRFNLKEMLKQINARLDEDFPNVEIWAEPGRFMCGTAVNLITSVIGVTERGGQPWYFLDDGLYGTFSGVIFDQWDFKLISFKEGEEVEATFAGPSCDSLDIMFRGKLTVRQEVGDLLLVPSCGAYTSASATTFNGFSKANFIVWEDLKDEIEPQPQAAMVG